MNSLFAYQQLKKLAPTFSTRDAAHLLQVSNTHASVILSRLAKQQTIVRLMRGRWVYSDEVDPLLLHDILNYPMLSYVSLYTALYYHGMIEQIPSVIYVITNGKTKKIKTPLATFSMHHINGFLFNGYNSFGENNILMATPEKALFDTFYLMPAKSNFFKRLTELEIPDDFHFSYFKKWMVCINNKSRRVMIECQLEKLQE